MSWRVLHVIRSLRPETGGLVEAVRNLTPALRERGHEVKIVSLDPADRGLGDPAIEVLGHASHGYGYSPGYVPWLRAHRREFDGVVVHGLWQYQSYGAWQALRGTDTPYFVYCHGMLDPWFKREYPFKHLKKWLYWPWADYRVLRDAAGVCYTSEEECRAARRSFWLYRAREQIVPLGIAPPPGDAARQREQFLAAHPALRERPFLLFLGRIHPKKGIENLLAAYAATAAGRPEAPALAIVGPCADAAYLGRLQAEAQRLGLGRAVHWIPMVTGDEKWGALHACEAFVLFSHQENFGVAVVEALACGRPVLISDRVNIWREIAADGAGFAGGDNRASGEQILARWFALPAAARAEMNRAARDCYLHRFAVASAADELIRALRHAADRKLPVATTRSPFPVVTPGPRPKSAD